MASDSVELPMSDDATSQMSTVKKLVQKLKSQMVAFREIENALPRRIRDVIKTLAEVLGRFLVACTLLSKSLFWSVRPSSVQTVFCLSYGLKPN